MRAGPAHGYPAKPSVAAADQPLRGNFLESDYLQPVAAPAGHHGPQQLFGDVWEWTASAYLPYPGFRPLEGSLGEYNGKFMSGQMVLRGGCATPESHVRVTYRNFFQPAMRWQFAGCAWPGALNMALAIHFHDQLQQPHEPRCATRPWPGSPPRPSGRRRNSSTIVAAPSCSSRFAGSRSITSPAPRSRSSPRRPTTSSTSPALTAT